MWTQQKCCDTWIWGIICLWGWFKGYLLQVSSPQVHSWGKEGMSEVAIIDARHYHLCWTTGLHAGLTEQDRWGSWNGGNHDPKWFGNGSKFLILKPKSKRNGGQPEVKGEGRTLNLKLSNWNWNFQVEVEILSACIEISKVEISKDESVAWFS